MTQYGVKNRVIFAFDGVCALALMFALCISTADAADKNAKVEPYQIKLNSEEAEPEKPASEDQPEPEQAEEETAQNKAELARRAYNDKDYDRAIELLKPYLDENPRDKDAWEILGWSYWREGRKEESVKLWRSMRTLYPESTRACNLLGKAYTALDHLEEARECFERSLDIDPDQPDILFSLGCVNRWMGSFEEAISILRHCYEENPADKDARLQLAKALISSRHYAEALPLWKEINASSHDNPDYMAQYAKALLNNAKVEEASALALEALELDDENVIALGVMVDAHQFGADRSTAADYLERLARAEPRDARKARILSRLTNLELKLWHQSRAESHLDNAIANSQKLLNLRPKWVDAHLMLSEVLVGKRDYEAAEKRLKKVLAKFNPYNIRARKSLFEIYIEQQRFDEAEKILDRIADFNPLDPYLHYYRARLEFNRGDHNGALQHIEKLERAGTRGAVAVLLYHGLSTSDYDPVLSVSRFKEQLTALKQAGFKFITPQQIPKYFQELPPAPQDLDTYTPQRVAVVTFDDGRRDAFEKGTPVAREMGITFAMHIPPPYIDNAESFFVNWDELSQYQDAGHWTIGSHLQNASDLAVLDSDGTLAYPLPIRRWLPEENRRETEREYLSRIEHEYSQSYRELKAKLGKNCNPNFLAYPYGDLGQQTFCNVSGVFDLNLEHAAEHYDMGFIQSQFGYAVKGDNPLLYQRHEPKQEDSGAAVVAFTLENHPTFLARRMRAEFEALQGNYYSANQMIGLLERDGYPPRSLKDVKDYVSTRLTGKPSSDSTGDTNNGEPSWNLKLKADLEYTTDSTDRRNRYLAVGASMEPKQWLRIKAYAKNGLLQQDFTEPDGERRDRELEVDELAMGAGIDFKIIPKKTLMGPLNIALEGGRRSYSGDAEHSENIYSARLTTPLHPTAYFDLAYEHDAIPWARSIAEEKTYNRIQAMASYAPFDNWDLWASFANYDYSDDNSRNQYTLTSLWDILPALGIRGGVRYSYLNSDEERDDYWTPYELNRYMAIAEMRKRFVQTYLRLQLRAGIGKEDVRPETMQAYQENLAAARGQNLAELPQEPEEDWTPVYGLTTSVRFPITDMLEGLCEISYSELPDYDETRAAGWIEYSF